MGPRRNVSTAVPAGERRNSHHRSVFGETGAVVGISELEQGTGIEPASTAWEAVVLPMY